MGKYFGTDGVRGIANVKLTSRLAYRIGRFIGQYPNGKKNKIVIGRDTRLSGAMLNAALISGITSSGGDVVDLGVTTTPSISYTVEKNEFDFGVMISASHNPFFDNGIKIFAPSGEKLSNEIELLIEDYIDSENDYLPLIPNDGLGRVSNGDEYLEKYLNYLANKANPEIKKLKVVFDCAHGSACATAKKLFAEKIGIENIDIINHDYTGLNINDDCGSTHIEQLVDVVKHGDYDLGVAFDGDADRTILVNHEGEVVDGDSVMFVNACYMKQNKKLNSNKVVITVMSNLGLKKALAKKGIDYEEVTVGDKYVQACLKEKDLSFGGEQSGHIIFFEDLNTGDGMLTALKTMNVLAETKKSLKELTKDLIIYPQVLKNVGVSNKDAVMSNKKLLDYIDLYTKELNGEGRILIRPSGTEQLIRVMVEAKTIEKCNEIAYKMVDVVSSLSY